MVVSVEYQSGLETSGEPRTSILPGSGQGSGLENQNYRARGSKILTPPNIPRKTIFLLYYDKIDRVFSDFGAKIHASAGL